MAKREKAAAAPVSAVAARKARQQQAAAEASSSRKASTSRSSRRASSSRRQPEFEGDDDEDDGQEASGVQVDIPLPSTSQADAYRASDRSAEPSSSKIQSPSTSKRPRRSSTVQAADSIAASRPRRSSVSVYAKPDIAEAVSTPKASRAAKAAQITPSGSSGKRGPASSKKKRKSPSAADRDESDDESGPSIEDILDEYKFGSADEPEQPPRKKTKARTPVKARKAAAPEPESSTKLKRKAAKDSPVKTPSKKSPPKKIQAKEPASENPTKGKGKSKATGSPKKNSLFSTPDAERLRAAKRYFAGTAGKRAKASVGSSAMPVEDEETGFLTFGDSDNDVEDDVSAAGDDNVEEGEGEDVDSDNSSEDDNEENNAAVDTSSQLRKSIRTKAAEQKADRKGKGRAEPIVLDSDSEEGDEETDAANNLTREALLDAIPYSNFTPVFEGNQGNVHVVENKRKRAKEALYFGMRHGETLVFVGIGHVEVLWGCVQIGGALVSSSDQGFQAANVFAPICNPLPVLRSVDQYAYSGQRMGMENSQTSDEFNGDDVVVRNMFLSGVDTIVKVTPLSSPITALGQACPIGGLATPFSMPPNLELGDLHQLSTIKVLIAPDVENVAQKPRNIAANGTFATAGLSSTYIPHMWQKILHNLAVSALSAARHPQEESVVALIRGSKKVGKSTLGRMALERLLSLGALIGGKVAYLELDLGQSDFGPPGMVTLHVFDIADKVQNRTQQAQDGEPEGAEQVESGTQNGHKAASDSSHHEDIEIPARGCITLGPGWCQPRVPVRAHFIGDVSPRDDPESYIAAVHDLIEYFRAEIQPSLPDASGEQKRVPLIINTQGWIKGLGADLASRLEPVLRPTHIFDVIPRGSPDPVPPPARGPAWLDADGAIADSGPEIVTLESVSQLEFVQGAFGQHGSNGNYQNGVDEENGGGSKGKADRAGKGGDGGSTPPCYVTEVGSKLAPAESRLLNVMSYLYAQKLAPASHGNAFKTRGTWDFSEPLVYRRPLFIDVASGLQAGIRVLALGSSVPDSLKLMAFNSSIVGIVVADHIEEDDPAIEEEGNPASIWKQAFNRAAKLTHSGPGLSTRCAGLGIVRSIDPASGQIHLLTPLDPTFLQEIQQSRCRIGLVKGALELPVWASLDFEAIKEARESRLDVPPATYQPNAEAGASGEGENEVPLLAGMPRNQVPYLEWPHAGTTGPSRQKGKQAAMNGHDGPIQLGSEKRRVRRNLMRKSQFA
ncbi:hypothetical protein NDA16_005016 [Ustilago loliicola]|nr:hypothetical protein NDA16_005016 [Ustilago loliicola]